MLRRVGGHVEVSPDVEHDAVGAVQGFGCPLGRVDHITRREQLQVSGAAVVENGDPVDLGVFGRRHVEELLVAVEGNPFAPKGGPVPG